MGSTGVAPTAPGAAVSPAAALRAAFHVNAIMMNSFQRYWSIFVKPFGCRTHPISRQSLFQGLSVYGPCAVIAWMAFTTPDRLLYRSSGASPESSRAAWLGTASSCCGLFCFQGARCFSIDGLILSPALFCSVIFTERSSALKEPYSPQRNQILPPAETFAFHCRICSSRLPKNPKASA